MCTVYCRRQYAPQKLYFNLFTFPMSDAATLISSTLNLHLNLLTQIIYSLLCLFELNCNGFNFWVAFTDMENGRNVSFLHSERASVNYMARRCILLFVLFMVWRQQWYTIETKRNAKYNNRNHYQTASCAGNTCRRILSVSDRSSGYNE